MAIVVLNAILGVMQESKAEEALAALKKMTAPEAHVIRDGLPTAVKAREVVPGDVLVLETGNYIPADVRLIESVNLRVEEASLTGESVPIEKQANEVLPDRCSAGRAPQFRLHGHAGHLRSRPRHRRGDRDAHRDRPHRGDDSVLRGRADAPAEQAGPARQVPGHWLPGDLRHRRRGGHPARNAAQPDHHWRDRRLLRRVAARDPEHVPDGGEPGHRRGARRAARHRDDVPGAGHARDGPPPRPHPRAARRGDAGQRHGDLLRQDGYADQERDDGRAALRRRPADRHHRPGLRAHRRVPTGRPRGRPQHVDGSAPAAPGRPAVQRLRPAAGGRGRPRIRSGASGWPPCSGRPVGPMADRGRSHGGRAGGRRGQVRPLGEPAGAGLSARRRDSVRFRAQAHDDDPRG